MRIYRWTKELLLPPGFSDYNKLCKRLCIFNICPPPPWFFIPIIWSALPQCAQEGDPEEKHVLLTSLS